MLKMSQSNQMQEKGPESDKKKRRRLKEVNGLKKNTSKKFTKSQKKKHAYNMISLCPGSLCMILSSQQLLQEIPTPGALLHADRQSKRG